MPDFERPVDLDRNNKYELTIVANGVEGGRQSATFTVEVTDLSEIQDEFHAVADSLRAGVSTYTRQRLRDRLATTETIMSRVGRWIGSPSYCLEVSQPQDSEGAKTGFTPDLVFNPSEQGIGVSYDNLGSPCWDGWHITVSGSIYVRHYVGDGWAVRGSWTGTAERSIGDRGAIGVMLSGEASSGKLTSFELSQLRGGALDLAGFMSYQLDDELSFQGFAGFGRSRTDIRLRQNALQLSGIHHGNLRFFGVGLNGAVTLGRLKMETDAYLSEATDSVKAMRFSGRYYEERSDSLILELPDITLRRLSLPIRIPWESLSEDTKDISRLSIGGGLVCEDDSIYKVGASCGQRVELEIGKTFRSEGKALLIKYSFESIDGRRTDALDIGLSMLFGPRRQIETRLTTRAGWTDRLPSQDVMTRLDFLVWMR